MERAQLLVQVAAPEEWEAVRDFYHRLIDEMAGATHKPGWKKGVYPTDEYLCKSAQHQELYVGLLEGGYAAAMILNQCCNEGYDGVRWGVEVGEGAVSVIHALGVLPSLHGHGLARKMVTAALEVARAQGRRAIRLDVLGGNLPAERLYTGMGFRYVEKVNMFYEDTGWTDYLLYEYSL